MKSISATSRYTETFVLDQPGEGGACHIYRVQDIDNANRIPFAEVNFQKGPIKENGVNGCHNEDLLDIVIHRLEGFQSGDFACRENAIALTHLQTALLWLAKRTNDRIKRGVEGTSAK